MAIGDGRRGLAAIAEVLAAFEFPPEADAATPDPALREIIWEFHGRVDFWTRAPLRVEDMQIDHVVPRCAVWRKAGVKLS